MSSLGERLLARARDKGAAAISAAPSPVLDLSPSPNPFRWGAGAPVSDSPDLQRILKIPRRPGDLESLVTQAEVEAMTLRLRKQGGTRTLRPIQAAALKEAEENGGLFGPMGVGSGKTDVSLLLPVVLQSDITVLLVPPSLKTKLLEIDLPHLEHEWRLPNVDGYARFDPAAKGVIYVVAYSRLSSAKNSDILDRLRPDLIVCDEAHSLKDAGASRTKRFLRFFRANPHARLCALSGSMTQRSIKDFAHIARFSLKENAPVPAAWPVLEEWAACLDAKDPDCKSEPGALTALCRAGETVEEGFSRRLRETPGVVSASAERPPMSLTLHKRDVELPEDVAAALTKLRAEWVTPSGEVLSDALSFSRAARQMASGLYLRWVWPESVNEALKSEWLEIRKAWHKELRDALKGEGKVGMDSPKLLSQAATLGKWDSVFHDDWVRIDAEFRKVTRLRQPPTEAVWINDYLVKDAAEWGRKNRGIIWYEQPAFGEAVAREGGFPRFGAGTKAATGIQKEKGKRTIVASVKAHSEGKNLQYAFHNQLIITPSSNPKVHEQLLGRTHRDGQPADEVTAYLYLHTPELMAALQSARNATEYGEQTLTTEMKLGYCTFTFPV